MFKSLEFAVTKVLLILTLALCLLQSFYAHCQSDIKTQSSKDSLVVLPKNLVIYMLQDLTQADSDRVELHLLEQNRQVQNELIGKQTAYMKMLNTQLTDALESYRLISIDNDSLEWTIREVQKENVKHKKQKNLFMTSSGILALLLLLL